MTGLLRVGIVGSGNMAAVHRDGWSAAGLRVAAVFGLDAESAEKLGELAGATVCSDFAELLERVDVVDICTPSHTHADYAITAAAAGKHVVCEKPLALAPADALAVVEACEKAAVKLLVGQVVRFFPDYLAAKRQIDAGVLGTPSIIRLSRLTYLPFKGDGNWFHDVEKSGGLVYDLMIHDFDYARWVAGDVKDVFAKMVSKRGEDDAAKHALVIMRHSSGALSHIEGSWMYPKPTFWTKAEIAGSEGLISWDSERDAPVKVIKEGSSQGTSVPSPRATLLESPWITEIKHFADVLLERAETRVTGHDALAAVRICAAVSESISSGVVVEVQP